MVIRTIGTCSQLLQMTAEWESAAQAWPEDPQRSLLTDTRTGTAHQAAPCVCTVMNFVLETKVWSSCRYIGKRCKRRVSSSQA